MISPVLLFNLLAAAVDLVFLAALWWKRQIWVWAGGLGGAVFAMLFLAVRLGQGAYGAALLASYGIFLHGAGVLLAAALVLRKPRPKTALLSAIAAAGLLAVAVDAFLVEPTWLDVSHVRLESPKLTRPVRLAVLADFQTDRFGDYEKRVLRRVLEERPDVILLVGDYIQAAGPQRQELIEQVNAYLRRIDFGAPDGAFAVQGNIDGGRWNDLFAGLPVTVARRTRTAPAAGISVTCLGMYHSFSPRCRVDSPDPERFHMVMGHSPNFARGRIEADLLIAGHVHGGQVRLPGFGPIVNPSQVPRSWAAGWTDLPGGGKLFVSRGTGLERDVAPRLRFFCRPELAVIDLVPE